MPGAGVSGRRVSFVSCKPSRREHAELRRPVFRSSGVPRQGSEALLHRPRSGGCTCSTGWSVAGSVLMREEKQLLSRRARVAERMCCGFTAGDGGHPSGLAEGATEGDGYTQTCVQSGAIAVRAILMDIPQAFSLGPSGGHTQMCTDWSRQPMGILWTVCKSGAIRVVRLFKPRTVVFRGHPGGHTRAMSTGPSGEISPMSCRQVSALTQEVSKQFHQRLLLGSVPDEGRTKVEICTAWSPWLHARAQSHVSVDTLEVCSQWRYFLTAAPCSGARSTGTGPWYPLPLCGCLFPSLLRSSSCGIPAP